jgi:uncharacterized ion transporter superfamily protein YfcC
MFVSTKAINKKNFLQKIPHTYVILFVIIIIAAIATYFVPAGVYDRVEFNGRMVVVGDSYHHVAQSPVGFFTVLMSFQLGMINAATICFFVFMVGGSVGVLRATKSIDAFLITVTKGATGARNEKIVIAVTTFLFSLLGGILGLYEEALGFMPFAVMLAISMGYDAVVGISMGLLGLAAGFAAAPVNPFTVGIAQSIAELPLFSGMAYRWVFFFISFGVTVWYILRYAAKVKADPSLSLVSDVDYSDMALESDLEELTLTGRRKAVLVVFLACFGVMFAGLFKWGWYINELAGLFFAMALLSGLVYGMGPSRMAEHFVEGAKSMTFAALIIGIARGIMVVLEQGMILDSIVYYLVQPLYHLPKVVAAGLMLIVQTLINFFIPSGSGQAMVTMPVMAPVADLIGITRQTAVLAFQYGDGFSNMFIPTLGATMACLAIAKIEYGRWIAYVWKLLCLQLIIGLIAVMVAAMIGLGPF